ncbi:MAG: hypothetical protein JOS17DRAFT_35562 [Linnemannia elongata]|nr:MAG: hypothetical protein JOS17DRAFT_35562 [Linnemannia elongata]
MPWSTNTHMQKSSPLGKDRSQFILRMNGAVSENICKECGDTIEQDASYICVQLTSLPGTANLKSFLVLGTSILQDKRPFLLLGHLAALDLTKVNLCQDDKTLPPPSLSLSKYCGIRNHEGTNKYKKARSSPLSLLSSYTFSKQQKQSDSKPTQATLNNHSPQAPRNTQANHVSLQALQQEQDRLCCLYSSSDPSHLDANHP